MGAIGWWLLGNGLAFGSTTGGGFVGTSGFALKGEELYGTETGDFLPLGYAQWLFQWAFAASATTIGGWCFLLRARSRVFFGVWSVCLSWLAWCPVCDCLFPSCLPVCHRCRGCFSC